MTRQRSSGSQPRSLLIATDLTPGCDRALDRAIQLARSWNAKVHVLHVMTKSADTSPRSALWDAPWREPSNPAAEIEEIIRRDIGALVDGLEISLHITAGAPHDAIMEVSAAQGCDLVVTGSSRHPSLRRAVLGSTVKKLLEMARLPILIVRDRVQGEYQSILAATDFSPAAAESFEVASSFFPDVPLTLFHGYNIPFSGILINDRIRAEFQMLGEDAARQFLAETGMPDDFPRIIQHGDPAQLLAERTGQDKSTLVVVGTHGSGDFIAQTFGSTAQQILNRVTSDVLVVPYSGRA